MPSPAVGRRLDICWRVQWCASAKSASARAGFAGEGAFASQRFVSVAGLDRLERQGRRGGVSSDAERWYEELTVLTEIPQFCGGF